MVNLFTQHQTKLETIVMNTTITSIYPLSIIMPLNNVTLIEKPFSCILCGNNYKNRGTLVSHEVKKHPTNRSVPRLSFSRSEDILMFRNSILMSIRNKLTFRTSNIGKKSFSLCPFPENVFVFLFNSTSSFHYSPAKRVYCSSYVNISGKRLLEQLFNFVGWDFKISGHNTKSFVIMENGEEMEPGIEFSWKEKIINDNDSKIGSFCCKFNTYSCEFQ